MLNNPKYSEVIPLDLGRKRRNIYLCASANISTNAKKLEETKNKTALDQENLDFEGSRETKNESDSESEDENDTDENDNDENKNETEDLDILGERHHPALNFKFPQKLINGVNRRCQHSFFEEHKWLHYDVKNDSVFCYTCRRAYNKNLLSNFKFIELQFITEGFSNWKKASRALPRHEKSDYHIHSIKNSTEVHIGKLLSSEYQKQEEQNRQCLLKIIDVTQLLARQGTMFKLDKSGKIIYRIWKRKI